MILTLTLTMIVTLNLTLTLTLLNLSLTHRFAKAMLATGIWTTFVFRLGEYGPFSDAMHFLGAG